jgi:hypothetical protein
MDEEIYSTDGSRCPVILISSLFSSFVAGSRNRTCLLLPPDREGERCFRKVSGFSTMRSAGSKRSGPAANEGCVARDWASGVARLKGVGL